MSSSEQAPEPTMDEILASIRRIIADDESQMPQMRPPMAQQKPAPAPQQPRQSASSRLVAEMEEALNRTSKRADPEPEDILELTDEVFEAPEPATQPLGRGAQAAPMQMPKAMQMPPATPAPQEDDDLDLMADEIDFSPAPPPPLPPVSQASRPRSSADSMSTSLRMPPRPEPIPEPPRPASSFESKIKDEHSLDAGEPKVETRATPKPPAFERDSELRSQAPAKSSSGSLEEVVRELLRPQLREWLDEHLPRILEDAVREELSTQIQERRRRH